MVALTNQERQAAFRARKRVKAFADKHFMGGQNVTISDFLTAVQTDVEALSKHLPAKIEADIESLDDYQQMWWAKAEELALEAVQLNSGRKMWRRCLNEATAAAHREAKLSDAPIDRDSIKRQAQRQFVEKMFPMVDDWFANWPDTQRQQFMQQRVEYPLHLLIDAFKTGLSLP